MIYSPSPESIVWEESLYLAIEEKGFCRSDAQSIVEVKEHLVGELFAQGITPETAAKLFID